MTTRKPQGVAAILFGAIMPVTACGSPSDAGAAAEQSTALPAGALAAWEVHAREACGLLEERFEAVAFASLSGQGDAIDQVESALAAGGGGFIAAELNGDGRPDFIVVTPGHGCVSSGPAYGQAGPPNDFVLSDGDGYRVAEGFEGWIGPAMITRREDRDLIVYGGGFNGRCGVVMSAVWGWTGEGMAVIERRDDQNRPVDDEGCPVATASSEPRSGGVFPPIPTGYYAVGTGCARAVSGVTDEDPPAELIFFDRDEFGYWDGGLSIRGFEDLGAGRWRVTARSFGNGDDNTGGQGYPADFTIRLTGPAEFIEETNGWTEEASNTPHTHCPDSVVPREIREVWFGR